MFPREKGAAQLFSVRRVFDSSVDVDEDGGCAKERRPLLAPACGEALSSANPTRNRTSIMSSYHMTAVNRITEPGIDVLSPVDRRQGYGLSSARTWMRVLRSLLGCSCGSSHVLTFLRFSRLSNRSSSTRSLRSTSELL